MSGTARGGLRVVAHATGKFPVLRDLLRAGDPIEVDRRTGSTHATRTANHPELAC